MPAEEIVALDPLVHWVLHAARRALSSTVRGARAHEARVCIHQGRVLDDPRRPRDYIDQQYLKSPEEMAALFADIPEALENSVEIARRSGLGRIRRHFHP